MNYLDRMCYDTGGYTVQEILSSFCNKILEIIELVNKNEEIVDNAHTIIENIRNEVVPQLVEDMMKELEDNGYFNNLVNVTLFNQFRNELTTLLNQTITDYTSRLDNFDLQLDDKATKLELANESARIDAFTSLMDGATTGDAELIDGRICYNSLIYKNIGSAIRKQIEKLDSQINNYKILLDFKKLDNLQVGFIGTDGNLNTSSTSHKVVKISAKNIKSFQIIKGANELTNSLCYGVFKKSDGTVNRIIPYNIDSGEKELTDENRECDIYLNWFNFNENLYCSSIVIKYISIDEKIKNTLNSDTSTISQEVIKYQHCVNKPFNFQGKEIAFFGDSITEGFVNGSSITPNGYPKLFAESVGATYKNYGVGGSCFSMVYNGIDTVVNKVKSKLNNSSPFAFISAGVNDWQCGVTKEQLRSAVTELCLWLKVNYTGTVIFITPINFAGRTPITTPQLTIWEVRQIITEVALSYNYNVVQGWLFPFPTEVGMYSSSVFGDGLHLSEDPGYKIYSQSLKTILC